MKKVLRFILLFISIIVGQTMQAQVVHEGLVKMKQNKIEASGNNLHFDMDVMIQGLKINRRESLSLYPVLFHNSDSLKLPPIILNGSMVQRKTERATVLKGKYLPQAGAYVVLENDPVVLQVISYKKTLQYSPWMRNCSFKLVGIVKDQNEKVVQIFSDLLTPDLRISN